MNTAVHEPSYLPASIPSGTVCFEAVAETSFGQKGFPTCPVSRALRNEYASSLWIMAKLLVENKVFN